ncbi:MAG: hypothetical protein IJC16_10695 [Rikenellaceae bacterium]|nr:hypothetical protein [Rikenellaceae bacterium]
MENKLEQLTQKLYNEGLAKGRMEADDLVAKAQGEAAKIIADARAQADALIKAAEQSAEELRKNTQTEIALASRQAVNTLRQQIERLVVMKSVAPSVGSVNVDPAFIKDMLLAVARNWNGSMSGKIELRALLPADTQETFDRLIAQSAGQALTGGLEVVYDNGVKSGFKIGPKDGSYYISFSDADFDALLMDYLRPKVAELLFSDPSK